MMLYYRGPDVIVTDEVFEVRHPYYRRFLIDELAFVHVVRHERDDTVVISTRTAAGALVLVATSWHLLRTVEAWLLAILLVAAPSALSGVCHRLRPRAQELRAVYRHYDVTLYLSSDPQVFGQVRRALARVLELTSAR